MENYVLIYSSDTSNFKVYLNVSNSELLKKFSEIFRKPNLKNKFVLIINAVEDNVANRNQFNYEGSCDYGKIYAIKIKEHRFYTIVHNNKGTKELYISRYAKKQTNQNDKYITKIIDSIGNITLLKPFES